MPARNQDLHGMVPDKSTVAVLLLDVKANTVPSTELDLAALARAS